MKIDSYHIQFFGPFKNEYVDWGPEACSVYNITGDQIADCTVWSTGDVMTREVKERHGWPGFCGCFKTFAEAVAWIEADRAKDGKTRKAVSA